MSDIFSQNSQENKIVHINLKLSYTNVEEFIEDFSKYISSNGIFINSKKILPKNTRVHFEYLLADESIVFRGIGVVSLNRGEEDSHMPDYPPGMCIVFESLEQDSKKLVKNICSKYGEGEYVLLDKDDFLKFSISSLEKENQNNLVDLESLIFDEPAIKKEKNKDSLGTKFPKEINSDSKSYLYIDLSGKDIVSAYINNNQISMKYQTKSIFSISDSGIEYSDEEKGIYVPSIMSFLSSPWPSPLHYNYARRYNLILDKNNSFAFYLQKKTIFLSSMIETILKKILDKYQIDILKIPIKIIIPNHVYKFHISFLENIISCLEIKHYEFISDISLIEPNLVGVDKPRMLININSFNTKISILDEPDTLDLYIPEVSIDQYEKLIIKKINSILLSEHYMNIQKDIESQKLLLREIRQSYVNYKKSSFILIAGIRLDLNEAIYKDSMYSLIENLLLTCSNYLNLQNRTIESFQEFVILTESNISWDILTQAFEEEFQKTPKVIIFNKLQSIINKHTLKNQESKRNVLFL